MIGLMLSYGISNAQSDFRNMTWGMEMSKVKSLENCRLVTEMPASIYYECTIADIKGQIVYTFTTNDLLMRAKYFFTPSYTNINFYIRDFKMFKELLSQKYGAPALNNVIATNRVSLPESEWPTNLLSGNLRLETIWKTGKTDIYLTLSRFNDDFVIQIDYISNEMSKVDLDLKRNILLESL